MIQNLQLKTAKYKSAQQQQYNLSQFSGQNAFYDDMEVNQGYFYYRLFQRYYYSPDKYYYYGIKLCNLNMTQNITVLFYMRINEKSNFKISEIQQEEMNNDISEGYYFDCISKVIIHLYDISKRHYKLIFWILSQILYKFDQLHYGSIQVFNQKENIQ